MKHNQKEKTAKNDNMKRYCARCEAEMDIKDWWVYPECKSCVDKEIENERKKKQ